MCGIAGVIGDIEQSAAEAAVDAMLKAQFHRGPDSGGHHLVPGAGHTVCLGSRRLAIIDLTERGSQPMIDGVTGDTVVFNGEIYNHPHLRDRLIADGVAFNGRSDTEVLLRAYQRWGTSVLDKLAGMYAFAIWDAREQRVLLGRDRLGIKPLYLTHTGGRFVFASEVRSLLASGLVDRRLDDAGLESFLAFGSVQSPLTLIDGVSSLPPGHWMTIPMQSETRTQRYWSAPFTPAGTTPRAPEALTESIRDALRAAVRRQLVSDMPVGLFLSGGIDSSALAILASLETDALTTFSITFREQGFGEGRYARLVAEQVGSKHHEVELTENDLLGAIPRALAAIDQPTFDGVNVFLVSDVAHDAGVTVVLSGQGGDELFAGYPTFRTVPAQAQRPGGASAGLGRLLERAIPDARLASSARLRLLASAGDPFAAYKVYRGLFGGRLRHQLLTTSSERLSDGVPIDVADDVERTLRSLDPIDQVSFLEMLFFLGNTLLRDGDFMSMAHSIEVRVPLLDDDLVDLLTSIPGRSKVDAAVPKPLLVRAVPELPDAVYRRPKQGFLLPWDEWLRSAMREPIRALLDTPDAGAAIGLRPSSVRSIWRSFVDHRRVIQWPMVWSLYVLLDWCERHGVSR